MSTGRCHCHAVFVAGRKRAVVAGGLGGLPLTTDEDEAAAEDDDEGEDQAAQQLVGLADCEVFDFETECWSVLVGGGLCHPRAEPCVLAIGGGLLVLGGGDVTGHPVECAERWAAPHELEEALAAPALERRGGESWELFAGPDVVRTWACGAVVDSPVWNVKVVVYAYFGQETQRKDAWPNVQQLPLGGFDPVVWRREKEVGVTIASNRPASELLALIRDAVGDPTGLAIDGDDKDKKAKQSNWQRLLVDIDGVRALDECLITRRVGALVDLSTFAAGECQWLPSDTDRLTVGQCGLFDNCVVKARRMSHLLVVAGGRDRYGAALSTVCALDTRTLKWLELPTMLSPRAQPTVAVFPDGSILVAGGNDGTSTLRSSERFNPESGRWIGESELPVVQDGPVAKLGARIQQHFAVFGQSGGVSTRSVGPMGKVEEAAATMRRAFDTFDIDGDGEIDREEFLAGFAALARHSSSSSSAAASSDSSAASSTSSSFHISKEVQSQPLDATAKPEVSMKVVQADAPTDPPTDPPMQLSSIDAVDAQPIVAFAATETDRAASKDDADLLSEMEQELDDVFQMADGDRSSGIDVNEFIGCFAGEAREAGSCCSISPSSSVVVGGRSSRGYALGTSVVFEADPVAASDMQGAAQKNWRPGGDLVPEMILERAGFGVCALIEDGPVRLLAVGGVGDSTSQTAEVLELRAPAVGSRWSLCKRPWDFKNAAETVSAAKTAAADEDEGKSDAGRFEASEWEGPRDGWVFKASASVPVLASEAKPGAAEGSEPPEGVPPELKVGYWLDDLMVTRHGKMGKAGVSNETSGAGSTPSSPSSGAAGWCWLELPPPDLAGVDDPDISRVAIVVVDDEGTLQEPEPGDQDGPFASRHTVRARYKLQQPELPLAALVHGRLAAVECLCREKEDGLSELIAKRLAEQPECLYGTAFDAELEGRALRWLQVRSFPLPQSFSHMKALRRSILQREGPAPLHPAGSGDEFWPAARPIPAANRGG